MIKKMIIDEKDLFNAITYQPFLLTTVQDVIYTGPTGKFEFEIQNV